MLVAFTIDRRPYIQRIRDPNKVRAFSPFVKERIEGKDTKRPEVKQLELQLTDKCNIDCYFCSYGSLRITGKSMSQDMICRALEIFNPELVILTGGGEPSLYRTGNYRFGDVVDDIGSERKIGMITNGTFVPEPCRWERFEWIRVSIEGNSSETYRKIRGKDYFDRVLQNIVKYCEVDVQNVGIGALLDVDTVKELRQMLERYFELWCIYKKVNVQMRTIRDQPEKVPDRESLDRVIVEVEELADGEFKAFLTQATNFFEWKDSNNSTLVREGQVNLAQRCYLPFLEVVMRPDGDIYPCDNTPQRDIMKRIGNIWDSPEAIARQQRILYESIVPKKCFACRYDAMNKVLEHADLGSSGMSVDKPFI